MKVKTLYKKVPILIAGSLVAAVGWLFPTLSNAQPIGRQIVEFCKEVTTDQSASPACKGACIAFINACLEHNGSPKACARLENSAFAACSLGCAANVGHFPQREAPDAVVTAVLS
jgi:hypothetical protein